MVTSAEVGLATFFVEKKHALVKIYHVARTCWCLHGPCLAASLGLRAWVFWARPARLVPALLLASIWYEYIGHLVHSIRFTSTLRERSWLWSLCPEVKNWRPAQVKSTSCCSRIELPNASDTAALLWGTLSLTLGRTNLCYSNALDRIL